MNRFGCHVVAPFYWQPTRDGLKGLAAANSSIASGPPVGQGTGGGAQTGAEQGIAAGSVAGPIGMAIGAIAGAIGGAIAGSINKKDPEQYNFDQAVALWQVNPDNVYNIGNKYLPLAGLFDLRLTNPKIPIYLQYGRMGEQRFVNDLVKQVYNAAQQGKITARDTPLTIMANVVQPWIDSWGKGPMVDPHADLINRLIVGMIYDYVTGNQTSWRAVGGDYPFGNLPPFKLPAAVAPTPAPVATPTINPVGSATPAPVLPSGGGVGVPAGIAGTTLHADSNESMSTPYGVFSSTPDGAFLWQAPGAQPVQVALSPRHTGGVGSLTLVWTGNQVVANNSDGTLWSFNPNTGQFVQSVAAPTAPPATLPVIAPTVTPIGSPAPVVPTTIPQTGATSPTVATTSGGQTVTQADLQAMVAQLAAQGQNAQQAYNSALQALQNQGVQSTPAVQSAVQGAIAATPAPASPSTAGVSSGSAPGWAIALGVVAVVFATARPASNPRRKRKTGRA